MAKPKSMWQTAPGLTAIAAVVTALATAGAVLVQVLGPDDRPSPSGTSASASAAPASALTKVVVDPTGAFSMEVPGSWSAGRSIISDLRTGEDVGPGLTASEDVAHMLDWKAAAAVLGASRSLAEEFDLASAPTSTGLDRATAYLRAADWTLQGCVYEGEADFKRDDYVGLYRRWRACGQVGTHFWELVVVPPDGSYLRPGSSPVSDGG